MAASSFRLGGGINGDCLITEQAFGFQLINHFLMDNVFIVGKCAEAIFTDRFDLVLLFDSQMSLLVWIIYSPVNAAEKNIAFITEDFYFQLFSRHFAKGFWAAAGEQKNR